MRVKKIKFCACGLHWEHTGKHAPKSAIFPADEEDEEMVKIARGLNKQHDKKS
jgi:hypothetical protein